LEKKTEEINQSKVQRHQMLLEKVDFFLLKESE